MKGIILAGGKGTRLYPLTLVTSKMLLPVYDKPMIYYPLSVLMQAGIRDILIITTDQDLPRMQQLLGDGSAFGIKLTYMIQCVPRGISDAFLIAEDFIGNDACTLILGDNIFYGKDLKNYLLDSVKRAEEDKEATIYGYLVKDPERFGIVELDENGKAISIEEKPTHPKSNYCVTGLYFYPAGVAKCAKELTPSKRGELEITDLNNIYLKNNNLYVQKLPRDYYWMDAGTHDSLVEASNTIKELEAKLGYKICCPEEICYLSGWISKDALLKRAEEMQNNQYGKYLMSVVKNN